MCLEAIKQKTRNDWFICTITCSKNVHVRSILEAKINKGSGKMFKAFE